MSAHQNKKKPLVSICIPTYNAEKTVVSTVRSILNQTYQNLEILVVDNASTDDTLALLQQFRDPRIEIYKNAKNIGAEKNWSKCIELANGEYIAIYHADDLYRPEMIGKQVHAFMNNEKIGAVFSMANYINIQSEVIGVHKFPANFKIKNAYYFIEIFNFILENQNFLLSPSAMVKSEIYKKLSPFNYEMFRTSADLDMWFRILKNYPIAILDEKLMDYRMSDTQGSFLYNCLRTDEEDYYRVMDFYLSREKDCLEISERAINKYELLRSANNITRAANFLMKSQLTEAKSLLKKNLNFRFFLASINNIEEPKYIICYILCIIMLISTYLKIDRYIAKIFLWSQRRWKRWLLIKSHR